MKVPKQSPLKQIRKQCLECNCGSRKSVRFCHSTECALWYLRFGKFSKTAVRENGKKFEQLFNKNNFKDGGKFSPDKEISSYEL